MRGLSSNTPFDFSLNDSVLRGSISLGVLCPNTHNDIFYEFIANLANRHNVKYNVDYVIPFPGFFNAFSTGLDIPLPGNREWATMESPKETDIKKASLELGNKINQRLDYLSAAQVDVALIYIPEEYEPLTAYSDAGGKFDLHDFVKSYAVQKNIATQFIRENTLKSDMQCQIMWALSLAIYVKSCRIPWVISGLQNDTAFAGIGYSLNQTQDMNLVLVGCSHVYSS